MLKLLSFRSLAILFEKEGLADESDRFLQNIPQWQISDGDICEYIWKGLNQLGPLDKNSIYCTTDIKPEAVYDCCDRPSSYRFIYSLSHKGEVRILT